MYTASNIQIIRKTEKVWIKIMRYTKGCTLLDHKRNDILKHKTDRFLNKLTSYKQKCIALSEQMTLDTQN